MYEGLTTRGRQVLVLAQEEARRLKHNYIGTEHILLGLLWEEEGLASRILNDLGINLKQAQTQVVRFVGRGEEVTSTPIPFTPRSKKVLELAQREAADLGHNRVGTEHILLGLVRVNEGVAARILLGFDANPDKVRNAVLELLSSPRRPGPSAITADPSAGPACQQCGGQMERTGDSYACSSCGFNTQLDEDAGSSASPEGKQYLVTQVVEMRMRFEVIGPDAAFAERAVMSRESSPEYFRAARPLGSERVVRYEVEELP
jgi:ATP-dependent Clp protease ATP-binding subunit ClpA